jgi:ABC-type polysaccharide/polyol phosphate export permease
MSIIPDELKTQTFPCPSCGQYISSEVDICKFCATTITDEAKQAAIQREFRVKKNVFLKNQKNSLILGVVLVVIGLALLLNPIISANWGSVRVPCLSPILIPLGIGVIILSLIGYYKEKRSK